MAKGYLYDNGDELITREDVNEVPDSSTAHAGDVLELDSNKKPKWSTPSGGGFTVLQMFVHKNEGALDYVSILDPNNPGSFLKYSELLEIAQDNLIYYILDITTGEFPGSVNYAMCGDFGEVTDVFATSFLYSSGNSISMISILNTECTDNQKDFTIATT